MSGQLSGKSWALVAAAGVTSMIPLWRAPRGVRRALALGAGALTGAGAFVVLRNPEPEEDEPLDPTAAAGVGAVAAVSMAGAVAAGIAADRWLDKFLVARGIKRPRLVIGVVSAAVTYGVELLDKKASPAGPKS